MDGRQCVNVEIEWLIKLIHRRYALSRSYESIIQAKINLRISSSFTDKTHKHYHCQRFWQMETAERETWKWNFSRLYKWKLWLTSPLLARYGEVIFYVCAHYSSTAGFYFSLNYFRARAQKRFQIWKNSPKIFLIIRSQIYVWALAAVNSSPEWKERKFDLISPISARGVVNCRCQRIVFAFDIFKRFEHYTFIVTFIWKLFLTFEFIFILTSN